MAELVERPTTIPASGAEHSASGRWSLTAARARLRSHANVRVWSAVRQYILVLSVLYIVKQIIFVFAFPAFSGHDEVAHYAHLRVVATENRLPVVPDLGDWRAQQSAGQPTGEDQVPDELYRYCRFFTTDWHCEPDDPVWGRNPPHMVRLGEVFFPSGWIYTANHPPLYYFILTPIYWLSEATSPETQLYIFRFAAIPFGLATVLLAYLLARALFPNDGFMSVVVPTFVAFQTQVSYEAAMLNNDILSIATYSLVLYLMVLGIRDRFPDRLCICIGVALGVALLSKGTALTAVGLVGLAVLLRIDPRDWRGLIRRGLLIGVPLLVLVAPWYAYLYSTYGNFSALSQIQALQYWNFSNQTRQGFFEMLFSLDFAQDRFSETWGEFGWRRIRFSPTLLWAIGVPLLICVVGLIQYGVTVIRGRGAAEDDPVERPTDWQKLSLLMLFIACVVAYLAIIQFGTEFSLTQARYYFPVVNAAAILLALGLRSLLPMRLHPYGQGAVVAAMVLLNTIIFTQYVIPYWQLSTT